MSSLAQKRLKGGWSGRLVARPQPWRGWRVAWNLFLLLAVWAVGVVFVNLGGPQRHTGLAEGQRAPATVVAAMDFECVNVAATALLRQQAAEGVVPVFSIQMGPLQAAWRTMEKLADRALALRRDADKTAAKAADGTVQDAAAGAARVESGLAVAADLLGVSVSGVDLAGLFPPGKEMDVLSALKESLADVWMNGILSDLDRDNGFQGLSHSPTIDVLLPAENGKPDFRNVSLADLPSMKTALDVYAAEAGRRLSALGVAAADETVRELARSSMRPNLDFDARLTEERRAAVGRSIEPVKLTVQSGTTLMEEGFPVTAQTVEMIDAYNRRMAERESPRDRRMKQTGDAVLLLIVLAMCAGWLHGAQPGTFSKPRSKRLVVALCLLALALASLYRYLSAGLNWIPTWLAPFAVPITLTTMLAMLILGPSVALTVGLWSGLVSALIFGHNFEILLLGLGGALVAVLLLRNVRKRSQVMRAGLAVGLLKGLLALAMAAMHQHLPGIFLQQAGTGVASGVIEAILALLLLPFVEWLFRHTTNISLLELTDMSHPLLQRLALEAPGTYHHSLMVGAIGQAAANRIGANGLLVAVCAYFHDVGKLAKPEFFNENQRGGENPHDSLAPSMSALVVQSHVKEGLTLAKRYKLPPSVCEGIAAHHGTTLTSYFYQVAKRALQEAGMAEDAGLEQSYRYDGPKPRTREMAILMLADGVEAASRSLEKATPNRIDEMVDRLMRDKLLDGQLDHCPLTLADLHEIRASFVFSLTNILHGRNPYPRENPLAQPATGAGGSPGGAPEAGAGAGGPGISG